MKKIFTIVALSFIPLCSYAGILDGRLSQILEVNGVSITANDSSGVPSSNPSTSEMRIFLDGVISELGQDKLQCRQTPHIEVYPENWNPIGTSLFGSDIDWRTNLYSVEVGHKSFKRAIKEIRELCAYSIEQSHILDFFENAGLKLERNLVAEANLSQTLSFITNLYNELMELEASGKANVILEIAEENGYSGSDQYSFFGADIHEYTFLEKKESRLAIDLTRN